MALAALLLALVLLALLYRRLRRLRLPPDADLWTSLRAVPLGLVVILDLLDLSLDFLSAPVAWALLGRLGLSQLRQVATLQALVPLTGPVPVMTLGWILARWANLGETSPAGSATVIETEQTRPGRFEPRRRPGADSE